MERKNILTKVLAVIGTVLVWFPILAPILFGMIAFATRSRFLFDYLMPAEFFPFALAGCGLLLWACLRARLHVRIVAWGFGIAVLVLFGGQWLAVVTGLASGERQAAGLVWIVVLASLAIYVFGLILAGTGGALLVRDLFKKRDLPA